MTYPRRRHRHADVWRPHRTSPLSHFGDGRLLLRERHVPSRASSGTEKAACALQGRSHLPAQGKGYVKADILVKKRNYKSRRLCHLQEADGKSRDDVEAGDVDT